MMIGSILRAKGSAVVTAPVDMTVQDVIGLLYRHRIGAVPIMEEGRIVGMLSERDVVQCLYERGSSILDVPARDIMTSPVVTLPCSGTVTEAMALMTNRRIRHLPVCEDDELVGLVSIGDLVKSRIEEIEHEAELLKDYIHMA